MPSPSDKAAAFRALHERPGAFVIPNPWDAGTARLLAALGFEALATTSLGLANMLGRSDASVSRTEVIANCASRHFTPREHKHHGPCEGSVVVFQSARMPASLMTLPILAISDFMVSASCSGELPTVSTPAL